MSGPEALFGLMFFIRLRRIALSANIWERVGVTLYKCSVFLNSSAGCTFEARSGPMQQNSRS